MAIYRLGPRHRDSSDRALVELKHQPFSFQVAKAFFRAQVQLPLEGQASPSCGLKVPEAFQSEEVPKNLDHIKGHYLWKQDILDDAEPMVSDDEYRSRSLADPDINIRKLNAELRDKRKATLNGILKKETLKLKARMTSQPDDYLATLCRVATASV